MPCIYRGNKQLRGAGQLERRSTDTTELNCCVCLGVSSPRTSVLLRCGDAEGEGGEGGARVGRGCGAPRSHSPVAEVEGTAGEAAAAAEEVGRFWKYCSPGSSSSRAPHGYTFGSPIVMRSGGEEESGMFLRPGPLSVCTQTQNISDLLQLQLQGPVAL